MGDGYTNALGEIGDSKETKALFEGPSIRLRHHVSQFFPTNSISRAEALSCKSVWKGDV